MVLHTCREVLLSRKAEKTTTTHQRMLNGEHDLPNTYPCEVMLPRKAEKLQLYINVGKLYFPKISIDTYSIHPSKST